MGIKRSILWNFVVPLLIWGIIAVVALSNPVPEEPENLSPETWSYYSGYPPHQQFLMKNRNVILVVLFLVTIGSSVILWITGYREEEK
jgi:hypothetical protein